MSKLMDKFKHRDNISQMWAILFVLPSVILFLIFFVTPVILTFFYSFCDYTGRGTPEWIGMANYIELFEDPYFRKVIINTTLYAIVSPILGYAIALGVSVLLFKTTNKLSTVGKVVVYIPTLLSPLVVGIMWRWIFGENFGFVNFVITSLGGDAIAWSTNAVAAWVTILIAGIWGGVGFNMILILGRLSTIPKDLYEAAEMDGASSWESFRNITIPMMKPITFMIILLGTIGSFKEFALVQTMTDGGPGIDTTTYVLHVYKIGFEQMRVGYASAASVLLFLFLVGLAIVQVKVRKGGEIE